MPRPAIARHSIPLRLGIALAGLLLLSAACTREREVVDRFSGEASFYADSLEGGVTANGETFTQEALTAAHRELPFGTDLRVTVPDSGKSVVVRVNDRGPHAADRVIDLSRAAAERLGIDDDTGVAHVEVEVLAPVG